MARMGEDCLIGRVHESVVEGLDQGGRPRVIWTDRVDKYLKENRLNSRQGSELYQDRDARSGFTSGFPVYGTRGLRSPTLI